MYDEVSDLVLCVLSHMTVMPSLLRYLAATGSIDNIVVTEVQIVQTAALISKRDR
eukprot:CAMPEP_0182457254 /NCGR_PEP_ID=MMETSP1319-20130603/2859_1 /TAXON_ID=172717 /ORGANISM="Bolidomonas pacifica, Strain RCC208" /LENGTH=54 /DNA_ID=CAMNT_0024655677 /DNA_START=81 /DNA_END=245 /DNA_ORIENTATION=+